MFLGVLALPCPSAPSCFLLIFVDVNRFPSSCWIRVALLLCLFRDSWDRSAFCLLICRLFNECFCSLFSAFNWVSSGTMFGVIVALFVIHVGMFVIYLNWLAKSSGLFRRDVAVWVNLRKKVMARFLPADRQCTCTGGGERNATAGENSTFFKKNSNHTSQAFPDWDRFMIFFRSLLCQSQYFY